MEIHEKISPGRKAFHIISLVLAIIVAIAALAAIIFGIITALKPVKTTVSKTPETETPAPEKEPTYAEKKLADMTIQQKVAGMFIFNVPGTDAATMQAFLEKYEPAGLIFMGDSTNLSDANLAALIASLQTDPDLPYLIATDEEGGIVARLKSDTFAAARTLKDLPVESTTEAFTSRTSLLKSLGFNLNFGAIADVTADKNSFIYSRVLGTTPDASADRVSAAVSASKGVLITLKHFPGHGATHEDSHATVPIVENLSKADWKNRDAIPFEKGIEAGADVVMMGHLIFSEIDSAPASLSSTWNKILRDELKFDGLIITDSMSMLFGNPTYGDIVGSAIAAINAGNDLILYANTPPTDTFLAGIVEAVQAGQIKESTLDAALTRILTARHSLATK